MAAVQKNVVVIGLYGVGKSSLVKMLCPTSDIIPSNNAESRMKKPKQYPCNDLPCKLHDTVGLPEHFKRSFFSKLAFWREAPEAPEVTKLEKYLKEEVTGGVDLLVYCISGQRCQKTSHINNYKRFKSVVDKVPIVVVVTGLDNHKIPQENWENWWLTNGAEFGMDARVEHACVTALLPDKAIDSLEYDEKKKNYDKSRKLVIDLFKKHLTLPHTCP